MKFIEALRLEDLDWVKSLGSRDTPKNIQCVYISVSNGHIVYVGTTKCLKSRLISNPHLRPHKNVYFTVISEGRFKLESKLIKMFKPKFNHKTGIPKLPKHQKLVQVSVYVLPAHVKTVKAKCVAIAARYR